MDEWFMQMALDLAREGLGHTSPNPMVGAVLVKDGIVIGTGYHARAGEPHAELNAIRNVKVDPAGSTLYVTLEPCSHHGKTPPCTRAIVAAGIREVVAAMEDPNPLISGRGFEELRQQGLEVRTGVLEHQARRLNEVFVKYITTRIPFSVLKAAVSLDGKIATRTGQSKWITGEEARQAARRLRGVYDAVLVGVNTVLADDPLLTARTSGSREPARVILDSSARTPPSARVLGQPGCTLIAVTDQAWRDKIRELEDAGAEVLVLARDSSGTGVDLRHLMSELAARNITSVLVEGGSRVHGSMLAEGLVDKVVWFVAPLIIGGHTAPGAVGGKGPAHLQEALRLRELVITRYGEDLCIQAYPEEGGTQRVHRAG
ncbi:MAG: bifunctional diaminohydroxyphosphoribosylaminopyrimidine deaminase/5-amino-6-(5-phosphoribosylamino)uracil reductase RibD [Bacillota bacterium]